MHKKQMNSSCDGLLKGILVQREKMLRNRRCRENITDFISLLSHYISHKRPSKNIASDNLYEYVCRKHTERPYGGYTVSIAIGTLPGTFKSSNKKQKQ